jgi:hypothetical protein
VASPSIQTVKLAKLYSAQSATEPQNCERLTLQVIFPKTFTTIRGKSSE